MPVRQYSAARPPNYDTFVLRLANEWQQPNAALTEPVVLEEPDSHGVIRHIYVVWSDWDKVSRETRGEIIMDAAERIKTADQLLQITIAMGLTPDEADRFGVRWR